MSTQMTHERLTEIFRKVGSKELTREGLNDLYDFKQEFPDADLTPYLSKTSQFFQRYIEQGLKNIALERERADKERIEKQARVAAAGGKLRFENWVLLNTTHWKSLFAEFVNFEPQLFCQ